MRAILRTNNMKASVDETGVRKQLGSCYSRKHREHKACSFPCGPEKMLGGCKFHQLQIRTRSQWFTVHSSAFEWLLYRITGYEKSVLFPTTLRNNIWQFVKCQLHVVPCTVTTAHAEADLCFPLLRTFPLWQHTDWRCLSFNACTLLPAVPTHRDGFVLNVAVSKYSLDSPAIGGVWYVKDWCFVNFILQPNRTYLLLVLH